MIKVSDRGPWAALTLLAALVTGCAGCAGGSNSSATSCAAPRTTAQVSTVTPGTTLTVSADRMFDDCADQGQPTTPKPLRAQAVTWAQSGKTATLATVDADASGHAEVTVTIPSDAVAGTAQISLGVADPLAITIAPR